MPIDGAGLPARVIRPRLAGGGARRAGVRNGRTRNGAPRLIGGDMDKSADERGNTGPTDGIKTKGDAGTLDAKLIITRRILWWIGLVLLLPFTLNLVHFDGPYLMLERILCAIPPKLASDPSSIVGLPLLEAEWFFAHTRAQPLSSEAQSRFVKNASGLTTRSRIRYARPRCRRSCAGRRHIE